jgi:elongator complex protein 1
MISTGPSFIKKKYIFFLLRLDYLSAYMACRKHRIDLNILYDHEPKSFLNNVELFVNQVEKVDYLNLFLSSLR